MKGAAMKTLSEKFEEALDVKLDEKTRERLDKYEEIAVERGELKSDILEQFLMVVDAALDRAEAQNGRS